VDKDGSRYGACTRTFLKDMITRAAERGLRIQAAFEPEFYLGVRNAQTGKWQPADNSGIYAETGIDFQAQLFTDITRALRALGLQAEMVIHEGGPGQEEISIHHPTARCTPSFARQWPTRPLSSNGYCWQSQASSGQAGAGRTVGAHS